MKTWILGLSAVCLANAASGQDCAAPADTVALSLCIEEAADAARVDLETALHALEAAMPDGQSQAALIAEQRRWDAQTEDRCQGMSAEYRNEPQGMVLYFDCLQYQTYTRAAALQDRLP